MRLRITNPEAFRCQSCPHYGGSDIEKRKPHYGLAAVKRVLGSIETLSITNSALRTASDLGYDQFRIVEIISGIERRMFFKSMTSFADQRLWQDVYHVPVPAAKLVLYVKFQKDVVAEFSVISFKEK